MFAEIFKPALVAVTLLSFAPSLVWAQTSGDSKSERGMPKETGKPPAESERGMPTVAKPAGTPPAVAERAMPSADKK